MRSVSVGETECSTRSAPVRGSAAARARQRARYAAQARRSSQAAGRCRRGRLCGAPAPNRQPPRHAMTCRPHPTMSLPEQMHAFNGTQKARRSW